MRFERIFVSTADRHTARPQIQFNVKYIFLDPHPRTKIQRVGTTDGERRRSEDSGIKGLRDWVHVYVQSGWLSGCGGHWRRRNADSTSGRETQERKGADRQCRRGESKDRGSEGTRTGEEGGRQLQGRRASDGARERGGDERKEGRPSTFYSRRFASGELGRHVCRVPTVMSVMAWKMNRFRCKCNDRLAAG